MKKKKSLSGSPDTGALLAQPIDTLAVYKVCGQVVPPHP
jgi:hypothetical protein